MARTESVLVSSPGNQSIEELQRRYQGLHTRKTQAETLRDAAKEQLESLKAQARTKHGTDDVAALQAKLTEMIDDNARKRAAYQAELDAIEQGLAAVERKFADAAPSAGGSGQARG
jgi:chromosome segregation ATPase